MKGYGVKRATAVTAVAAGALLLWPQTAQAAPLSPSAATPRAIAPLIIGTALPDTGELASYGKGTQAAVRLAINDLNAAGGVLGAPVTMLRGDSGDAKTTTLVKTLDSLRAAGAQSVVGPMSSSLLLANLSKATGLTLVSPATTSPLLTGEIYRVVPSDVMQGVALAKLASIGGVVRLAVVAPKSATTISDAAIAEAKARHIATLTFTYPATIKDASALAASIAAKHPDGIIFAGGAETGNIVGALVKRGMPTHVYFTSWAGAGAASRSLPRGTLLGAKELGPDLRVDPAFRKRITSVNSAVTKFDYTPQAYDSAAVIGLAAAQAGHAFGVITPDSIAAAIPSVTTYGQPCTSIAVCLPLIGQGLDVDYVGVSGPLDISEDGDPVMATYVVRTFGGNNEPGTSVRYVRVP